MNQKHPPIPSGIESPICSVLSPSETTVLFQGHCALDGRDGSVTLTLHFFPVPRVHFEFAPTKPFELRDFTTVNFREVANLELVKDESRRVLSAVRLSHGATISGVVDEDPVRPNESHQKLVVINGPKTFGSAISFGDKGIAGRTIANVGGCRVTLDLLPIGRTFKKLPPAYMFTHVMEIVGPSEAEIPKDLVQSLSWTLSFMKSRWVGVVGPWHYDDFGQELCVSYQVTKVSQEGHSASWFNEGMLNVFPTLAQLVYQAIGDPIARHPLITAMHWSIESSLCAGGVEGSLVLQQSALECLSWYEIVQKRKLCPKSKFKTMRAEEKIRWLLTLSNIDLAIPIEYTALAKYASEKKYQDVPAAMVGIRNVLVHAEPEKSEALFTRPDSEDEISQIWGVCRWILQQAILASLGYNGNIVHHNRGVRFVTQAVGPVPWHDGKPSQQSDIGAL